MFSGLYPIRMAVSEDDGRTWSELKPIGDFGGVVAMASVVHLKTAAGHYMALFHDDGRFIADRPAAGPRKFQVYKTLSTDGGLTWGKPEVIATHPTAHLCEPGAIRSPDGKQIAVLLRENSRKLNSLRDLLRRRGEDLDAAAASARRLDRRPARGPLRARRPAVHHLPRHDAGEPDAAAIGSAGSAPTTTSSTAAKGSTASA